MSRWGGPSYLSAHLGAFEEAGTTQMERRVQRRSLRLLINHSALFSLHVLLVNWPASNSATTLEPFTVTSSFDNAHEGFLFSGCSNFANSFGGFALFPNDRVPNNLVKRCNSLPLLINHHSLGDSYGLRILSNQQSKMII